MDFTSWDAGLHTGDSEHLEHYGVLGMKWGMRRYQNKDGSLTPRGEKHYAKTGEYGYHYKSHATKKYQRKAKRAETKAQIYRDSSKEVRGYNRNNDFNEKRNNRFASKWDAKANKLSAKAAKYRHRAERSASLDAREQEAAKKISVGKALATRAILGGAASKSYQQFRAMAGGGKAGIGTKTISRVLAYKTGTIGSRIAKAAYIRKGEKSKGVANTINKVGSKVLDAARVDDRAYEDLKKRHKK